jgi:hypothetical protein
MKGNKNLFQLYNHEKMVAKMNIKARRMIKGNGFSLGKLVKSGAETKKEVNAIMDYMPRLNLLQKN